MDGYPHRAFETFSQCIEALAPYIPHLLSPPNELTNLYRVRKDPTLRTREEIFHIPFSLRHKVMPQRFSLAGWPSPYLGASLLVCWEELGRPAFHELSVARFDAENTVRVLDLGYQPALMADLHYNGGFEFFQPEEMRARAVCWPLLAACSFCAGHPGEPFIEEYIVPQLLMQAIRAEKISVEGLRYFSTRMSQPHEEPRIAINYVFPTQATGTGDFCANLSGLFNFTLPMNWPLFEGTDLRGPGQCQNNVKIDLNPECQVRYDDTVFGKMERQLNNLTTDTVIGRSDPSASAQRAT